MTTLKHVYKTLTYAVFSSFLAGAAVAGDADYRIQIPTKNALMGLKVAPLPLKYKPVDRLQVGYGSYLVNVVGTCNGCHATKEYANGGDPFKGEPAQVDKEAYLRGGVKFGDTVSASIRPTLTTGLPHNLTLEQFVDAMRFGKDADEPNHILQVMPWPSYQSMSTTELKAIYKYLVALPPALPAAGAE